MLKREATILFNLKHKNIIYLLGIVEPWDFETWLVTEYCNKGNLKDFLNKETPSVFVRLQIAIDIASGLHYLHSQGIVHFDVKPANILIHEASEKDPLCLKIADFGLATYVKDIDI